MYKSFRCDCACDRLIVHGTHLLIIELDALAMLVTIAADILNVSDCARYSLSVCGSCSLTFEVRALFTTCTTCIARPIIRAPMQLVSRGCGCGCLGRCLSAAQAC